MYFEDQLEAVKTALTTVTPDRVLFLQGQVAAWQQALKYFTTKGS